MSHYDQNQYVIYSFLKYAGLDDNIEGYINMNETQEKIVKDLEEILKNTFVMEFNSLPSINNSTVTPLAVFERWYRTTKAVHPDNLIDTMCLRATQAGYLCYPMKDELSYSGLNSGLKDDEITKVIYGSSLNGKSLEQALKELCRQNNQAKTELSTQN